MKTWKFEDWHFIEVDGITYVELEDTQRELAKLRKILELEEPKKVGDK